MPARRDLDSWNTYSDQAPSWLGTDFTKPAHLLFLLSSISFLGDPRQLTKSIYHSWHNDIYNEIYLCIRDYTIPYRVDLT